MESLPDQGESGIVNIRIQNCAEVDSIVAKELTVWLVLAGHLILLINEKAQLLRTDDIFVFDRDDSIRVIHAQDNRTLGVGLSRASFSAGDGLRFGVHRPLSRLHLEESHTKMRALLMDLSADVTRGPADSCGLPVLLEGCCTQDQAMPEKIREIIDFVHAHYKEKLTLDRIADVFYGNKFYLSHLFTKHVGMTIGHFIREVRLVHSVLMMKETDRTIADIARHNGFPNSKSFEQAFREVYGTTAGRWREGQ